jgi:hypothetical protein
VGFELASSASGKYSVTIAEDIEGGFRIENEECTVVNIPSNRALPASIVGKQYTCVHWPSARSGGLRFYACLPPVFNLMTGITMYSPNAEAMRKQAALGTGTVLSRDASNAADVVARLKRTAPQVLARVRD